MKFLRIVPLAVAVTFTSTAFADTPKKDTGSDKSAPSKDSKSAPKDAPKTGSKTPAKDTKPPTSK